jgi:hypothetical protein
MIITISLPMAVFIGKEFTRGESTKLFIAKSFMFLNQVGLLHILPTFIPLLLLSIPVLYMLKNGCVVFVVVISLILFVIGNMGPYVLTIGDKAVFPIILWQIIFIIGVLLGKKSYEMNKIMPDNMFPHIIIASIIFISATFIYHGHHLLPALAALKSEYHFHVSKYPLNYLGMLYHGSIVYFIYCITVLSWKHIIRLKVVHHVIMLFGRYSMQVFIIHVYYAYAIVWIQYFVSHHASIPIAIIVLNFVTTVIALRIIEKGRINQVVDEVKVLSAQKGISS